MFKAKVRNLIDAIVWVSRLAPYRTAHLCSGGRAVAIIDINKDTFAYNTPRGAAAQVAVYTGGH
jgi:hypothetical protein